MICKYCGIETTAENGICKACSYKLRVSPNQNGGDIYSSSGMAEEINSKTEAPRNDYSDIKEESVEISDFIPQKAEKLKLRKSFVAAVILVVLFIVLCFTGVFKSATAKIKDNLEKGNYSQAYSLFSKEFTNEGSGALNKMLEQRLDNLYEQYRLDEREYEDVKEEFSTIEKMGITELKKKINSIGVKLSDMRKSKNAFQKAEKYYGKKNYALSIKEYKEVLKNDSNFDFAEDRLKQAVSNYRNTVLSEAASAVTEGDYASAVSLLESALDILKKDKLIEERIREYGKSETLNSRKEIIDAADEYAFNENYSAAITVIMTALENNEELETDETVMNNLEEYRKLYTEQFSEKIDEYIEDGRYEEAAELLEQADKLIPKSKTAEEKKQLVEGKMPQYLHKLYADDQKNWSWNKGESTDSFGSSHSGARNYILLGADSTATYDINGEYESFKCRIVAGKGIDPSVKCKMEITATLGGEYLYREWEISAETEEQEITMVTKDCTSLKISISGEGAEVLMFDARLSKD